GPFVTEEEIRTMADVAADAAVIEREERRLIHSIFEFGDTVVREVMSPRPDMVGVELDETIGAALERAIERGFSRLPAYEGSTDNIAGLVFMKDLVRRVRDGEGGRPVRDAVRPAVFVPEQKRVAELLREMQTEQFHMAVVIDEYGSTAGLVTLEDLLEEIVGEITDEYDVESPVVEHLADGALRVPGRTSIDKVSDELGTELPDAEWDTVGGLVFNLLGHVPVEGEIVRFQGLEFRAERVQGHRIVSVQIRRPPERRDHAERLRAAEGHEPRERPNARARATLAEVDVVCLLIEASAPIGPGDRFVAGLVHEVETPKVLVVNKIDIARRRAVAEHLVVATAELGEFDAYVPLSGATGEGVDALVEELEARLPEGPV